MKWIRLYSCTVHCLGTCATFVFFLFFCRSFHHEVPIFRFIFGMYQEINRRGRLASSHRGRINTESCIPVLSVLRVLGFEQRALACEIGLALNPLNKRIKPHSSGCVTLQDTPMTPSTVSLSRANTRNNHSALIIVLNVTACLLTRLKLSL